MVLLVLFGSVVSAVRLGRLLELGLADSRRHSKFSCRRLKAYKHGVRLYPVRSHYLRSFGQVHLVARCLFLLISASVLTRVGHSVLSHLAGTHKVSQLHS